MSNFANFDNLNISTITIIVESSVQINLKLLADNIINLQDDVKDLKYLTQESISKTKECMSKLIEHSNIKYKLLKFPPGTVSYLHYNKSKLGHTKKNSNKNIRENDFRNQVTINIFIPGDRKIHAMFFSNGKIKLAGCKNTNDAMIAILYIYEYTRLFELIPDDIIEFIFSTEMINSSTILPFTICKSEVRSVFSKELNYESFYEETGHQHVITKYTDDLDDEYKTVLKLVINPNGEKDIIPLQKLYNKKTRTSFMFFPERVIMSSVDTVILKRHYEKIIEKIITNERLLNLTSILN